MTTYLSWDCGTRALAYCSITIDISIYDKLHEKLDKLLLRENKILSSDDLDELNNLSLQFLQIHDMNQIDLLDEKTLKKTGAVQLSRALKQKVDAIEPATRDTKILIEHQPRKMGRANVSLYSKQVEHQLMYHYNNYDLVLANASHKNKISAREELTLDVIKQSISGKTGIKYRANKKHSLQNFLYLMKLFEHGVAHINKKYLDDVADAFMQALAYCILNSKK